MIIRLVKTEFLKYKRYNILWFGIASVLFSIILAVFQMAGTNNSVVSYTGLSEGVVWNHFSLFLPFTFTLIVGYSINREYTDATLKNLLAVPVSKFALTLSKLIAGYGLVIAEWICSFSVTLLFAAAMRCGDICPAVCGTSLRQLLIMSTCCYIAVLPVIIVTTQKQDKFFTGVIFSFFYGVCGIFLAERRLVSLYPVTIGLVLSDYAHDENVTYAPALSVGMVITLLVISLVLLCLCSRRRE